MRSPISSGCKPALPGRMRTCAITVGIDSGVFGLPRQSQAAASQTRAGTRDGIISPRRGRSFVTMYRSGLQATVAALRLMAATTGTSRRNAWRSGPIGSARTPTCVVHTGLAAVERSRRTDESSLRCGGKSGNKTSHQAGNGRVRPRVL
jgi:hypothetical protein